MDISKKRKRINYSVKTQMQIRLFLKVLSISLICVGLMAAIFYFYSNRAINDSYRQFHMHAQNFLEFLTPAILLSFLTAIILAAAVTLFLPIKYAGPLFRIERDLKEKVANGDLTVRFHLRKGDEVCDLAEALNICLTSLGEKITKIKGEIVNLDSAIKDTGKETGDAKEIVQNIKKELEQITL